MARAKTHEKEKTEDHSFSLTAETSFKTSLERSAKAGIGVAEGSAKFTAEFSARLEANTHHAWRKSDRYEDATSEEYVVLPYSDLEVTISRGTPNIRQIITTHGKLDANVQIYIGQADEQKFGSIEDIANIWQGLKPGARFYSDWFQGHRVPEEEVSNWLRPHLTLDLEITGKRVRYGDEQTNERAVPGKEKEFEEARKTYNEKVSL